MKKKLASILCCLLLLSSCGPLDKPTPQGTHGASPDASHTQASEIQQPTQSSMSFSPIPQFHFPEFPIENLIHQLPETCVAIGSQSYSEPAIDASAFSDEIGNIALQHGTRITIETNSDETNGETSSIDALISNPGPDGISLREAVEVTNNDPGSYTIEFAPALRGASIQIGSWNGTELPPLEAGSVVINGDIDGDREPDVILENHVAELTEFNAIFGIRIHSSSNMIHALGITGFTTGILFDAPSTNQVYAHNSVSYLAIEGQGGVGLYSSQGSEALLQPTNNRWEDIRIIGNRIAVHNGSGISFAMHWAAGETIEQLIISDNDLKIIDGGNAIELSPGFGTGSGANRVSQVLISNNTINGNPESGIALMAGFMGGGNNSIRQVQILGNTIRGTYTYEEYMHTFGMHISAGFWINQSGNEISDVLVAQNSIEGNFEQSILLSSGAVGSSGNIVERIRFTSNHIKVPQHTREDNIPIMAVGITTGDGASDYYDPGYQPVVYPNDNILRDVWISGNLIEGQGGYGIMVSTGDPGSERNSIERIYMLGNEFLAFFPESGVLVSAISLEHGGRGDNYISEVYIQQNSIHYTNLRSQFGEEEFVSGGIVLSAGNGASMNLTQDIWIIANEIDSPAPGINLVAGWAQPQFPASIGNTIRGIRIWCNAVTDNPTLLEDRFPGIKGINLAGGWGLARDNLVENISIAMNRVAGVEDAMSVFADAWEGSQGNSVRYP